MLDWLKTILGEIYTEDIDKQVSAEIGKGFVAKSDFNTLNETKKQLDEQIAEHDKQLKELEKSAGTNTELAEQLKAAQESNKKLQDEHKAQLAQIKLDSAVERALMESKAKNVTATKALLSEFLATAEVDDKGEVKGLAEAVKRLREGEDTAFMFDNGKLTLSGAKPGESEDQDRLDNTDDAVSFAKAAAKSATVASGESNYFK